MAETSTLPPSPPRVRAATRRKADALLKAAAALIAEKGFEATAIRDVGRRLESLKGDHYDRVLAVRRRYYRLLADTVAELLAGPGRRVQESARSRHLTLFIFGMLNWSLTWYRASRDGPVEGLAREMLDLVLHGARPPRGRR